MSFSGPGIVLTGGRLFPGDAVSFPLVFIPDFDVVPRIDLQQGNLQVCVEVGECGFDDDGICLVINYMLRCRIRIFDAFRPMPRLVIPTCGRAVNSSARAGSLSGGLCSNAR